MYAEYRNFFYWLFLLSIPTLYVLLGPYQVLSIPFCESKNVTQSCQFAVKSYRTHLNSKESLVPYDYRKFDFCNATEGVFRGFSLGGLFLEERLSLLSYEISFLKDVNCATQCQKTYQLNQKEDIDKLEAIKSIILKNYQHNWYVEGTPLIWWHSNANGNVLSSIGFPVGCYGNQADQFFGLKNDTSSELDAVYLFNHIDFIIRYQNPSGQSRGIDSKNRMGRIVQATVQPRSIRHQEGKLCDIDSPPLHIPYKLGLDEQLVINYTYSVHFVKDEQIEWSSRFNYLFNRLASEDRQIVSIEISFIGLFMMLLIFSITNGRLCGFVCKKSDCIQFSSRLVHGGALRPPRCPMLLSLLLGIGFQVLMAIVITFIYVSWGFLPPVKNNTFVSFPVTVFSFLGAPAGFLSFTMYKAFGGKKLEWQIHVSVILFSSFIFVPISTMNYLLWNESSVTGFLSYVGNNWFWWILLSMPLPLLGVYVAHRREDDTDNCTEACCVESDQRPLPVPRLPIWAHPIFGAVVGGIVPFTCISFDLVFILNSIWHYPMYYMFGYFLLDFMIFIIACSGTTLSICSLHLKAGDYRWCWRSILTAGSISFYIFLYCIYYLFAVLRITELTSIFIYFGYTLIMIFLLFLLTGCIGFFTCYWFVHHVCKGVEHITVGHSDADPPPYEMIHMNPAI